MLKSATHCVAFTGAGISTSAGIGDYRGKSGKWTLEDQEITEINEEESSEPPAKRRKTLGMVAHQTKGYKQFTFGS